MTIPLHRLAVAALGLLAFNAAAPSPAAARVWTLPQACKHGASGDEFDDPPVVDYSVNGVVQPNAVQAVAWQDGVGFAQIWVTPHFSQIYQVAVAYTPFLVSAVAINPQGQSKLITDKLPPVGQLGGTIVQIFDQYEVTIEDQSNQPMAGATVLWSQFFNGGDPYITTTDVHGQLTLDCVENIPNGYSVYVISADGQNQFEETIVPKSDLAAARGGRSSGSQHLWFGKGIARRF